MNKTALCPISDKQVNSLTVRIHALINVGIITIIMITQSIYPALYLFADFIIRVANFPQLSLSGIASRAIARALPFSGKLENAGPKQFAARIGLLFSAGIFGALIAGDPGIAFTLTVVLGLFSLLEGAFGFCMACVIYPFFYRLVHKTSIAAQ